jgi:Flp pilus assembly protein TadG/uncharacterized protein YegL
MMACKQMSRLLKDRSGNFGMMTAILLPVLIGAGGVALDLTNMMMSKTQLQEAADSAALAASTALATGEAANEVAARKLAMDFFIAQMGNYMGAEAASALAATTDVDIKTTTSGGNKSFAVSVGSTYNLTLTPLMGVLGYQTMNIATSSTSTSGTSETRSALSMTLVLDESGSMLADTEVEISPRKECAHYNINGGYIGWWAPCMVKKIEALEMAANLLLDQLDKADPKSEFVRTSAINWSSSVQETSELAWGTENTRNKVIRKLSGGGGTESSAPMKKAYDALTKAGKKAEEQIHLDEKGNEEIQKYIVFMTDGNNNHDYSDAATLAICEAAKKANITIYSVAFKAPSRGQNLLKQCATGNDRYFKAESMKDLVEAFQSIGQDASKDRTLLTH